MAVAVVLVERVVNEEAVVVAVLVEGPVVEMDVEMVVEETLMEEELELVEALEDIDDADEVVVDWIAEPVSKTSADPPSLQKVSIEP